MSLPLLTALLLLLLLTAPAAAENGVLTLPKPGAAADNQATSQPAHPQAAPVAPVHKAAPTAKAKPTPVVRPPAKPVAERPPTAAQPPAPPQPPSPPPPAKTPAAADTGSITGLKLPRFAALRSDEVNMRVGPGTRFPIEWQYHRRNLPVQILREVEVWRLVEDEDGVKGWVHQATLVGRRGFVVRDAEAVLRQSADDAAPAVARLKEGVVGRIRACAAKADWCEVQVSSYRGFLRRTQFWGTFPGEAVHD